MKIHIGTIITIGSHAYIVVRGYRVAPHRGSWQVYDLLCLTSKETVPVVYKMNRETLVKCGLKHSHYSIPKEMINRSFKSSRYQLRALHPGPNRDKIIAKIRKEWRQITNLPAHRREELFRNHSLILSTPYQIS